MLQPDTLEIFPTCPTYGFTVEPRYLVKITMREGGYETRNRKWSRPLHRYTAVPLGDRHEPDVQAVLEFWHAHGGSEVAFRFKDYADFKSCRVGVDATPLDQPFVFVPGSPGGYQLVKVYTSGARTQQREILKPKGDTIRIANQSGVEQAASTWLLDEGTGLLQTLGGFSGTPGSWGGEFYVPCRFDSEFSTELTNINIQRATFAVAEIRVPLAYE